jgi:tetratricopeptide (TPR) repeat protein
MLPGYPASYLRLARVYVDWGRSAEAIESLAEAEWLGAAGTNHTTIEWLWVDVSRARADWPGVVEHARRLLAVDAGDRAARHALARAYVEQQEWEMARAEYEELLECDRGDSLAHEQLGALFAGDDPSMLPHLYAARTDLSTRLLAALTEAAGVNDPAYTHVLLGRALLEAGEWSLAVRRFELAVLQSPGYADARAYLGHALDLLERPREAEIYVRQAVDLAPDSPVAHLFLGLHYDRLGDIAAARAAYETAYELDPGSPVTCLEIGYTRAAEGRYDLAEIWLVEGVSLQPQAPALVEALARFYLDHNVGVRERGVAATERLLELLPAEAWAHDLRGWAAVLSGDHAAARESLEHALALDPSLASAHYHLGVLHLLEHDSRAAQEAFVRALDLDTTGGLVPLVERALADSP